MSEQKVLLFGSFSEDETKTWLNKTLDNTQKPQKNKEIKNNSTKSIPDLSFGTFNTKSSVESKFEPSSKALNIEKSEDSKPKENGENYSLISNGNKAATKSEKNLEFSALNISEKSGSHSDISPRGLMNSGNLCFLNATLQALLSCSPFVQLIHGLKTRKISKVGYPTLAAFVELIVSLEKPSGGPVKPVKGILGNGRAFSPVMFDTVLRNFTPDVPSGISGRPRQEDTQEFLSYILDHMHEELVKLEGTNSVNGKKSSLVSSSEEDDGWETVGPKNKSAITRTQNLIPSQLSEIFGGQLRSVVKSKGNKASATVEPFMLLHLDISHDGVHTIEEAFRLMSASETVEGYKTTSNTSKNQVPGTAKKSISIQAAPKIMILHLKRFTYGNYGSTKLHKPVRFPHELLLNRDLLVSPTTEGRRYKLFATITHHGREASKGHYTADALYSSADGQWLRFDDASVINISPNKVLHDQAYVLFYKQI